MSQVDDYHDDVTVTNSSPSDATDTPANPNPRRTTATAEETEL